MKLGFIGTGNMAGAIMGGIIREGLISPDEIIGAEVMRLLFQTIDQLPPRCREIFLLYMDGMKNEKIAETLQLALDTVKNQKKKALHILRERLGDFYFFLLFA